MGRESKLIVDVEEHKVCGTDIEGVCLGIDSIMTSLVQYLNLASASGLEAGQSAESFSTFVTEVARLQGKLKDFGTSIKATTTDFLGAIDDADDLLFKNKGYKPFTDEEFRACFAVVENTTAPSLNGDSCKGFLSNLLDKILKFIWKMADIEVTVGNDESILRNNVENLKEQTVEKISIIKEGVRSTDRIYRQNLKNQLDILKIFEQALRTIDSIVSSDTGTIDIGKLTNLTLFLDQYDLFVSKPVVVTDEDVKDFADNVSGYFDSSTLIIHSVCAASIGQLVTSDFDRYRATISAARDYFNSYSSDFTQSHEEYEKYKDTFDQMLKLYNKYGNKWVDYYEGDKEKAEPFNKLVKKAGEVSKKSDDYVDIWFQLFCDMSESKEAFARFKSNCDLENAGVQKALERVEALYNNEVDAYVFDTLEKIAQEVKKEAIEKGSEAVAKAYANIVPGGGMEKIMTKMVSSVIEKAFSEAPAVAQYDYVLATQSSFDNAVANLKAATRGSPEYDNLVLTVREAFDNAKQARINFFTTIAKDSSGQQKTFYNLNIESLKTMSLDDVTVHKGVSPGEFYGENANVFGYVLDGDVTVSINW